LTKNTVLELDTHIDNLKYDNVNKVITTGSDWKLSASLDAVSNYPKNIPAGRSGSIELKAFKDESTGTTQWKRRNLIITN